MSTAALTLAISVGSTVAVAGFDAPKRLGEDGWDAEMAFGADVSSGSSNSSSVSLEADAAYRHGRAEIVTEAIWRRSDTRLDIETVDAAGEPALDATGDPITREVSERTADRRFVSLQPRWYLGEQERYFTFALLDYERNRPVGVDSSAREIVGMGLRFWTDKANHLIAGIGIGHKRQIDTAGERAEGGIGYFGLELKLGLDERTDLGADLTTDFGGDSNVTELGLALAFRLREPISLKLGFDARVDDARTDDAPGAGDDGLDTRASVALKVDLL